jgi:magnesium and cobalt transporter
VNNLPATKPDGQASPEGELTPSPSRFRHWLKSLMWNGNGEASVRDTLDELIDEREEAEVPINADERLLLANILELRDRTVHDVMVPRADIVGIELEAPLGEVIDVITREGHSRLPVYQEDMDDSVGFIHAKDVLAWRTAEEDFLPAKILRKILFVSPSMQVLELLLEMRLRRSHMALVVDEYGGIDGLVTIEDLVEEIVGEIEDEHDTSDEPQISRTSNGSYVADARVAIETLEQELGDILSEDEREDLDTLGGLVFALAGHVPVRGELVHHPSGLEFEVLDADPRRIKRLRFRKSLPVAPEQGSES